MSPFCLDVDECEDATLVNGGCSPLVVCSNTVGGRTCGGCPSGYAGNGRPVGHCPPRHLMHSEYSTV